MRSSILIFETGNAALSRQRGKAAKVYLADGDENADEWVSKTMGTLDKQSGKKKGKRRKRKKISDQGRGLLAGGMSNMQNSNGSSMGMGGMGTHPLSGGGGGHGGGHGGQNGMSPMNALQLDASQTQSRGNTASSTISEEPSAIVIGGVSIPSHFNVGQTSKSQPFKLDSRTEPSYPGEGRLSNMANEYAPLTSALVEESSIMNTDNAFYDGNGGSSTLDAGGSSSIVNPFEFDRFPGSKLTLEITSKQEGVDKLMLHAALRTFIPMSSDAVTGEQAFNEFIQMPRGLLKVQRESEVARFSQPYIKILKYAGMKTIESLKQATTTQLTALGLPSALAEVLCRLVRQLFRSWKATRSSSLLQSVSGVLQPPDMNQQSITSLAPKNHNHHNNNRITDQSLAMPSPEQRPQMPGNAPNIPEMYTEQGTFQIENLVIVCTIIV